MKFENSRVFAQDLDANDSLKNYRNQFFIPQVNGKDSFYFTGNSLGAQPKAVKEAIQQELDDWAEYGVEGHFHAKHPWYSYHELFTSSLAKIVGAKDKEVVAMNGLTQNLHLLMVSFYQPEGKRFKIVCEGKAFPSDQYALESQVKFHGYDPKEALIEVFPRDGEHTLRLEDIKKTIEDNGDEIALVMMGGVNYYTGQVLPMKEITKIGHKVGAIVGFDLAHGAGNAKLFLNEWGVDFAAWCSYKYLNSGPGGISGVYINEKHVENKELNRFAGWWGHNKDVRFLMEPGFDPIPTAEGWQLSNAPVLAMAAHKASLEIFDEVGMPALWEKSEKLSGYLEFIIKDITARCENAKFEIITPLAKEERGCQVSMLMHGLGKEVFDKITEKGVIADWREPNVIRLAPVPLYNTFEDVYEFGRILEEAIS